MKNCLLILLAFFFFTSVIYSQTIQWQQLSGPHGGTPLCFVSKGSERFVGMDQNQGGVYRSSDDETAWGQESSGIDLDARTINWLAVDDSGYVIAGTNSHIGSRVYKSTDNGESWFVIENMGGNSVAQNEDGHIYVGNTGYGQYSVSTDGGYTWIHHSHTSPFINCIEINDSGHIFIGGNYTGYRSTDNGATWTNLPLPDGINSFAFAPNGDFYAGCSREYASNSGVYKSTDNGESWTPVKEGFRVYPTDNIVINYAGDIFVGSDGWGIWRSTDEGSTWTQQNSGLHHFYIRSMYILSDGNIYAGALGGGIYRSTDNGESWRQTGVTSAYVKDLKVSPANGSLFASVVGMSRSTNAGLTWEPINNGISQRDVVSSEIKSIAIKSDGTIFIGFTNNWPTTFVYRSTDNGDNWTLAQSGIQGGEIRGLVVDDSGYIYASTDHYGIYKSTNNGDNWFKIGDLSGGKLVFNSAGDLFLAGDGVWRLSKNDSVWVKLRDGGIWTFFCSSNDYLFTEANRSTDNGLTWANMPIGNVAYSYTENSLGHLFAGTFNFGSGVKRSTDFGETWESINSGIPTQDVRSVAIDADDYLYAGPWGYSLFKTTTPTVQALEDPTLIAYYPFNGNANDESGYDNHGNVIAAVLTTDRFSIENSAYEFDGSSNYISIPNSFSLQSPTNELTQLAWVNIYSWTGQGFWVPVLMKSNSGDNAFQYRLSIGSNGVNTSINNWNNGVVIPETINFNAWYMVATTLKNDTVKVYVNGVYKGEGTLAGPINLDTKPLEIGRDVPGSTEYFHGKIDDIRIYNRAITEREIDSLYDGIVSVPVENNSNIPISFNLEQNYPNPFNPSTKISWQSPVGSHQTIKIFDVLGREIETIVEGYYDAGNHSTLYIVNSKLPSCVYFYQLKAGDFVQTKKMLLLK